jgi:replicative DNA helicase
MINRKAPPDTRIERKIITGMITSTPFLREVKTIYTDDSFTLPYAKTVAQWCIQFFDHYKVAPYKNITDLFASKSKLIEETQADAIEEFLVGISEEYEEFEDEHLNVQYLLDQTEEHFRLAALDSLRRELAQALTARRVDEAEALIGNYRRIARVESQGVNPIIDIRMINDALDTSRDTSEYLMTLPGELGRLIGDLERGFLFAVLGNSGTGKTWWLWFISFLAAFSGLNVLFINLEMTTKQMIRRVQTTITGLPLHRFSGPFLKPVFDCDYNQQGSCSKPERACNVRLLNDDFKKPISDLIDLEGFKKFTPKGYKPCTACRGTKEFQAGSWYVLEDRDDLTTSFAVNKAKIIKQSMTRLGKFKMLDFPSGSITANDLRTQLANLEYYENFEPDVIVTDYADKFRKNVGGIEYRNQIRHLWEEHKAIAQERHCLVVTASQSSAGKEDRDIKKGDWAESISKLELIDVGFSLNQTDEEKMEGMFRAQTLKQRHEDFNFARQVMVLSSLKIGRPYLDSHILPYKTN